MIPVHLQNFTLLAFLLLVPFQMGSSHRNSIFTSWNRAKFERKSLFMPENIFSGTKLYSSLHFHGFEAKQKIRMFDFLRPLISKTTAATPG